MAKTEAFGLEVLTGRGPVPLLCLGPVGQGLGFEERKDNAGHLGKGEAINPARLINNL